MPMEMFLGKDAFWHVAGVIELRAGLFVVRSVVIPSCRTEFPGGQNRDRRSVGVEQELVEVETVAIPGLVGTIHAIGVQLAGLQPRDPDMPNVTGSIAGRVQIDDPRSGAVAGPVEQFEAHAGRVPAKEGKVHSIVTRSDSQRERPANADIRLFRYVRGIFR